MSDIVERLKNWNHGIPKTMIVSEAIDEIERLRGEVRYLRIDNARLRDESFGYTQYTGYRP
jgi:hypothetical protein